MRQIVLDGNILYDDPHSVLAEKLDFPAYYGRNLDALYDCLTDLSEETELYLIHWSVLGEWGQRAMCVLADAAEDNPNLSVYSADQLTALSASDEEPEQ